MRPVRFSLSTVGLVVLLIAADLAAARSAIGANDEAILGRLALPMGNLLVLAFHRDRTLRRSGRREPFWVGFQTGGWAALVAYLVACRADPAAVSMPLARAFEPVRTAVMNNLSFEAMRQLDPTFRLAWLVATAALLLVASGALTVVMVAPALAAGRLTRCGRRPAPYPSV